MNKSHIKLATKIIEQHGNVVKSEDGQSWGTEITILGGMGLGFPTEIIDFKKGVQSVSKDEATQQIIKQLAGELDSGAIELSDTWEADNLK